MSFPGPSTNNGSSASSPVQRLLIAIGTLVVVALTVVAAILLAVRNPESPVAETPVVTPTTAAIISSPTPTVLPPATNTATIAPSPSPTSPPVEEAVTNTPQPLPASSTPVPPPPPTPTSTFTPIVVIVTPTPLPATEPSAAPAPGGTPGACQAPSNWTAYVVQVGDTLNSLAERTNASVYDLQQVNCFTNLTVQPGQTIYLPFTPPTPTITPTSTPVTPSPTPTLTGTPTATPRAPEIFTAEPAVDRTTVFVVGRNFEVEQRGFRVELRGATGVTRLTLGDLKSSTSFEAKLPPCGRTAGWKL
ncbi:MAG: LysM peptidoglycan-binding domain-containing protein [Anaerolineales bacterium]|nr:LysM peptidoglycan-binding domain-containing protein [Anaerolineales bacterium]